MKMIKKTIFSLFALLLSFGMSASAVALQYAYPDSTVSTGSFTSSTGSALWEDVDEEPASNGDYIYTNTDPDTVEFGLTDILDPNVDTGHIIRARAQGQKNGQTIILALYQGGTEIATSTALSINSGSWTDVSFTIPSPHSPDISNYNDLRIRVTAGGANSQKDIWVSWIRLETPEPAVLTAPTVTVQAATAIGTRSATLNGTVTVNGSAADNNTYFKYGTSSGSYTVTTPSAGTVATGSFSYALTGLDPDTTYYYIACATANESGGLEGCSASEETFTTSPLSAPTVTVQAATAIGTRSAALNGTITVNGTAADNNTYFEYGTSSGPPYDITSGTVSTIATGTFSLPVTGLEPGTLYYYRACATANEAGGLTGCSGETTFTTDPLVAPTVTVQSATLVTSDGATLHGTVTSNGSAADNDTYFKYGTSSGVYTVTTGIAGTVTTGGFQLAVTGLDPETTYYYIACATANETDGLEGCSPGEQSFTTTVDLTAPTVTVQPATAIGTNGATLNGNVTVNGSATDNNTYFKYGTSSGVYTVTTGSAGTVTTGAFSLAVSGLDPNTTYYYVACATANEPGGLEGCSASEQNFTTLKLAPIVTVQPATVTGSRTATLNGTVTTNGSAPDNNTYFKYGTSSGVYTITTPSAGTVTTGAFSYGLTGLEPDTAYYYIACATANESGGLEGCSASEETFTTDPLTAPTVTVQAATSIGSRTATLNGTVTVNGSAPDNDTYFEYGTSSGPPYDTTSATVSTLATGPFALPVSGLEPDTLYYYRACATASESGGLTGCSTETTFTTDPLTAPTVSVQAATSIGSRTATLNGTVTVNGSAPDNDTYFEYGTSSGPAYDVTSAIVSTIATGAFSLPVSGLDPDTLYYYRACATANEAGGLTGCSTETTFTTDPLTAPVVTVQAATAVGTNGATLNGTVTANGSAVDNDTYFKYGTASGGPYDTTTASAGTVVTGTFAKAVTGLDSDVTYYYIACATANETGGLEGCSAGEESFTTVASVSQPTNPWFHNIGSTAMTLFWTEGIGDGSIVLMKQGGAVDANPAQGNDTYIANSVFGTGTQIGSGNYVVYKGNGESVHITGLTASTVYHIAIYTFTGSGTGIEYLLTTPAIANEATLTHTPHNVAILNVDDTVGCDSGCHGGAHSGGALVARGAAQEAVCVTCHNPDSVFDSAAKNLTNFALHTNSMGTPPDSPGEVDCGGCHEVHSPTTNPTYSYNPVTTTSDYNLYYLKKDVTEYVTGALSEDMVMHAEGAWILDTDTYRQGPCQICHTDSSLPYTNTSSDTGHQGGSQNCKGCHTHTGGFSGAGGDCTGCHGSVQDLDGEGTGNPGRRAVTGEFSGGAIVSSHLPGTLDAADCEVCHDQSSHQAGQVKLFDPDGGASILIAGYTDPRTNSTEAAKLTAFCEACHDSDGATRIVGSETSPFSTAGTAVDISSDWTSASHNTAGSVSCFGDGAFGCHGSGHGGQKLSILAPAESGPGTDNSDEREAFCFTCHSSGGMSSSDIEAIFTSTLQTTTVGTVPISNRHDVMPSEQSGGVVITCNNCHLPHEDNSSISPFAPVSHPDDGSTLGLYDPANYGGGNDPTNPVGGGSVTEPDYIEFCLACHDGSPPAGITMPAGMTNIATAYTVDNHGMAGDSDLGYGTLKSPWTTGGEPGPYAALNCTTCHGSHGTGNIHNLRTEITVAGQTMYVGPRYGYDPAADSTYYLPDMGTGQEHLNWGAWCTFCHNMDNHNPAKTEDSNCLSGHVHGNGGARF